MKIARKPWCNSNQTLLGEATVAQGWNRLNGVRPVHLLAASMS